MYNYNVRDNQCIGMISLKAHTQTHTHALKKIFQNKEN